MAGEPDRPWGERAAHHLAFAPAQRRVLAVLLGVLLLYAAGRYALNPAYVDAPQPPAGDLADRLADRLDPNTASAADLAALPGLGEKRARLIVERRETVRGRDPAATAFAGPDDLLVISGFGRSTVAQLRPHLVFPTDPTTNPSPTDKKQASP